MSSEHIAHIAHNCNPAVLPLRRPRHYAQRLNIVGLRGAGFEASQVAALKQGYRNLYLSQLKLEEALARIETEVPLPKCST
jgi:acyl-[acyl carrier protein]--UDP-N-acetylglucosamine O-acyltransferase